MGIIKSKFKKMDELDCSTDTLDGNTESRSPTMDGKRTAIDFSTPINNDLLVLRDSKFRHLAQAFMDPRSPSEGIVRTPIVLKSGNNLNVSITRAPLVSDGEEDEDENETLDEEVEAMRESFEQALSKISFENEPDAIEKGPVLETHFDSVEEIEVELNKKTLQQFMNLVDLQSDLDPRSPTIGIERTPLVLLEAVPVQSTEDILGGETKMPINNTKAEIFVDEDHTVFGSPMPVNDQQQQVRTPLSCLANRPALKTDLLGKNSPLGKKAGNILQPTKLNADGTRMKNKMDKVPFEPRRLIR